MVLGHRGRLVLAVPIINTTVAAPVVEAATPHRISKPTQQRRGR